MTNVSPEKGPRFAAGFALGAVLALGAALGGAVAWSLSLQWLDDGEPRALSQLRSRFDDQDRRLDEQDRRLDEQERRFDGAAAEARSAAPDAERSTALEAALEREREADRRRHEQALQAAQSDAATLREELARTNAELSSLSRELAAESATRRALESEKGALLERTLAAELREHERDALRSAAAKNAPIAQTEVHGASSSWVEELARKLPAELLGPVPQQAAPTSAGDARGAESGALAANTEGSSNVRDPAEAEALRRAEVEAVSLARKQSELEDLRAQVNRLLELDGYGEMQIVRLGAVEDGALRDVAFRVIGAHGEDRRFVAAAEMRLEAFPGLRSVRAHLRGGYEQVGGGAAKPFENEASEITWADVRIEDWRALLQSRGLWSETGTLRTGAVDPRYPAAETLAALNDLFARAKGTRKFVLRRLDEVHEGAYLHGIELHQNEVGGNGLKVIFEAESAEIWWDPAQKTAELVLEHGFQRRGAQRVPFFDQRARVFLSYDETPAWDETRVPFHVTGRTSH